MSDEADKKPEVHNHYSLISGDVGCMLVLLLLVAVMFSDEIVKIIKALP